MIVPQGVPVILQSHSSFLSGEMMTTIYLFEHLLNSSHVTMGKLVHV